LERSVNQSINQKIVQRLLQSPERQLLTVKHSVPEYVFYVFFGFQKIWLFTFFEMTCQTNVKSR